MDNNKFEYVSDIIPNAIIEIRYYNNYNFVGERIDGYLANKAILTKEACTMLKKANDEFFKLGYVIKIYDAYRPSKAVDCFIRWSKNNNNYMKKYFYPNIEKEELFKNKYIDNKSAHSRGSCIDLTLYDIKNNCDLDMGSTFDMFSDISHTYSNKITTKQKENRLLLKKIMEENNFINYDKEWWHYTLKDEPYPNTYFNFDIE